MCVCCQACVQRRSSSGPEPRDLSLFEDWGLLQAVMPSSSLSSSTSETTNHSQPKYEPGAEVLVPGPAGLSGGSWHLGDLLVLSIAAWLKMLCYVSGP